MGIFSTIKQAVIALAVATLVSVVIGLGWYLDHQRLTAQAMKAQAAEATVRADLTVCRGRVDEFAAGEQGYRNSIAQLTSDRDERDRELAESVARVAAMDARRTQALSDLLATQAARRDADARATTAAYQATEAFRALDELMLRWLAADPAAPPGLAAELRARGYGERTISGGG